MVDRTSGLSGSVLTSQVVVIGTAVSATGFFALSTALKHRSADTVPASLSLGGFLRSTLAHRYYLAAMVADVVGLALQITALHLGALTVVQPLMITSLLFSLVLTHHLAGTRITGRELLGGLVLVAALVGFLVVSGASSPSITGPPQPADREPAAVIGGIGLVGGLVFLYLARRASRAVGAVLIGVIVGFAYAGTAALIKAMSDVVVTRGLGGLLLSWQLYTALAVGAGGLVLAQLAFRAGPLRSSLPTIATVDPLVSIVLGVFVYEERLRPGPLAVAGEVLCLAVLFAAAVFLGRLTTEEMEHDTARQETAVR